MKINNNLIQPNTIPASSGAVVPDQGAAFADRLAKAVRASEQSTKSPASDSAKSSEDAKLKATCQQMEAVFLNMMLTRMRATVPKTKLLGERSGEETIQSLLDTELTKDMAKAGGMGLADMLYRQLSKKTVKGQAAQ